MFTLFIISTQGEIWKCGGAANVNELRTRDPATALEMTKFGIASMKRQANYKSHRCARDDKVWISKLHSKRSINLTATLEMTKRNNIIQH